MNKALEKMVQEVVAKTKNCEEKILAIAHCNCPQRAALVKEKLEKAANSKDIFVLDMKVFKDMSTNIGRITGSINQIAKRVNSTSIIYKDDINDLKKLLEKQGKDIYFLRKKLYELGNLGTTNTEEI